MLAFIVHWRQEAVTGRHPADVEARRTAIADELRSLGYSRLESDAHEMWAQDFDSTFERRARIGRLLWPDATAQFSSPDD